MCRLGASTQRRGDTDLGEVDITAEEGDFEKSATVNATHVTPAELEARRRVDCERFTYHVYAELEEAELDSVATIKSIRVQCSRR